MRWAFLSLFFLLAFSSCTRTTGGSLEANGRGFAGVLDLDNGRPRCTFKEESDRTFQVSCKAMVVDADGTEQAATMIKVGVSLDWKKPFRVEGGEITVEACRVASDYLSQQCNITLQAGLPSKIQFDLVLNDVETQRQKTESDVLLLPVSARSFGRVAALLNYDTGNGVQNTPTAANEAFVDRTHSVCEMAGSIYFSVDQGRIFRVRDGMIQLYAGSTNPANNSEYSHRVRLHFGKRDGMSLACGKDAIYTIDREGNSLLKILESGAVLKIGNNLALRRYTDGGLAMKAITVAADESIYLADANKVVRVLPNGSHTIVAGNPGVRPYYPQAVAVTKSGTIYIADNTSGGRLWTVTNRVFTSVPIPGAVGLALDPKDDRLYLSAGNQISRRLDNGEWQVVAGAGVGFSGDGGSASEAAFNLSYGIAFASDGAILVADAINNRIRKFTLSGMIQTVAGRERPVMAPSAEYTATSAQFGLIKGLAIGADDTIYAADSTLNQIHQIDPAGNVTVRAGTGAYGFAGDGGDPKNAQFRSPSDVLVTDNNELYIADTDNERIRRISGNEISTYFTQVALAPFRLEFGLSGGIAFSKSGTLGFGDPTLGLANPPNPLQVYMTALGTNGFSVLSETSILYLNGGAVRELNPQTGESRPIAGTATRGFSGDGGPALQAMFGTLNDLVVDQGIVYLADTDNGRIRTLRREGDSYRVDTLLGGSSNKDCTGVIEKKVRESATDEEIRVSLSALCYSKPLALAVRNHCEPSNPKRHLTLAIAQSFGTTSNIVRVRRPCP